LTIADLVADLRAPTPSAAAEAVSPDGGEWLARFIRLEGRLQQHMRLKLTHEKQLSAHWLSRLQQAHPEKQMQRNAQRLDELELRLSRAVIAGLSRHGAKLQTLQAKLNGSHPARRLQWLETRQGALSRRLVAAMVRWLERQRQALQANGEKLHAVSPLATLERGYAIASRGRDGIILRTIADADRGEAVAIRLSDGVLIGQVLDKRGL
jgi:exodeoxyribonuclease VII large subunit